jgi:glycerophosphoryl diester phosphodiesterase
MPRAYKNADVHAILQMGRFPAVHVDESFYSDTLMGQIRKAGMRVWINALGKYDELEEKAMKNGTPGDGFESLLKNASQANFIQTNYPEQLLSWLRKKGLHR